MTTHSALRAHKGAAPLTLTHRSVDACGCASPVAQQVDGEQRLYARGANGAWAYGIDAGIVRFERVTAAGGRRIIRLAGQGDLIGLEALLGRPYADDVVTCTAVQLHRVSIAAAVGASHLGGTVPLAWLQHLHDALDATAYWSAEVTSGPAKRRMLQLLLRLQTHSEGGGLIWLPKREQMADMLNITLETSSRVLSALRRDGVLTLVGARQARLHTLGLAAALETCDH